MQQSDRRSLEKPEPQASESATEKIILLSSWPRFGPERVHRGRKRRRKPQSPAQPITGERR
jgi:hypothetical protein